MTAEFTDASDPGRWRSPASVAVHLAAGGWIIAMLLLADRAPDTYAAAMQEDHLVEWWTAVLYAAAAATWLVRAVRHRRLGEGLVGLFCVFVAGEEFSWGQRLFGFTPPSLFLAHNTQQEFNLHNFAEIFGRPKWVLAALLLAFGVLLPLATRTRWGRALALRLGVTPPPLFLSPWFGACVALLVYYPVEFTGEWVECLAGFLFLASAGLGPLAFWPRVTAALVVSLALSAVSARGVAADPDRLACARVEAEALLLELTTSPAALDRVFGGAFHKRAWTVAQDGYLMGGAAAPVRAAACTGAAAADAEARRRYVVDPWGTAYWIRTSRAGAGTRRVVVYSFGPNRRRDGDAGETGPSRADDIVVERTVTEP